jgi:hypothetical protein
LKKSLLVDKFDSGEEVILVMMDELLDLISNILKNLITKGRKVEKNFKVHVGNFYFDKNVLVLTQNSNLKKVKERRMQELMPEKSRKVNEFIRREAQRKPLNSKRPWTGASHLRTGSRTLLGQQDIPQSTRNTVSKLLLD